MPRFSKRETRRWAPQVSVTDAGHTRVVVTHPDDRTVAGRGTSAHAAVALLAAQIDCRIQYERQTAENRIARLVGDLDAQVEGSAVSVERAR